MVEENERKWRDEMELRIAEYKKELEIDNSIYACWGMILRVVHGLTYLLGVPYIRTLAFIGSIICLAGMALALL